MRPTKPITAALLLAVMPQASLALTQGAADQNNAQSAQTVQTADQGAGGGVMVGNLGQTGGNSGNRVLNNVQTTGGPGTTVIGPTAENNVQATYLFQDTTQGADSGGTTVGNVQQGPAPGNANTNFSDHTLSNNQGIATVPGTAIIGGAGANNTQTDGVIQQNHQLEGGGVVVGASNQGGTNTDTGGGRAGLTLSNTQTIGGGSVIVGNPLANNLQGSSQQEFIGQSIGGGTNVGGPFGQTQVNANSPFASNTTTIV